MNRELEIMSTIQEEKAKEIAADQLQPLDEEGRALSENKRFTFDIVDIPSDPLR